MLCRQACVVPSEACHAISGCKVVTAPPAQLQQHHLRGLPSFVLHGYTMLAACINPCSEGTDITWRAGVQIRNTASVGGNIVTGSPISDMNPLYMAARAVFVVGGQGTPEREVRCCQHKLVEPEVHHLRSYAYYG